MNQVACPHCGIALLDDGSSAGQAVACPHCGGRFRMPGVQAAVAPPSPPVPPTVADAPPPPFPTLYSLPDPRTTQMAAPPVVSVSGLGAMEERPSPGAENASPHVGRLKSSPSQVLIYVLAGIGLVGTAALLLLLNAGGEMGVRGKPSSSARGKNADYWVHQLQASASEAERRKTAEAITELDAETLMDVLGGFVDAGEEGTFYRFDKGAMACLAAVGPKLLDSLPQALQAKSENVRIAAAHLLRDMGPEAKGARGALEEALDDESRRVRHLAATALGNLGRDAAPAVPKLIALLDHEDGQTRLDAVETLGKIGPEAQAAVPALKRLLEEDKAPKVRAAAEETLALVEREGAREE